MSLANLNVLSIVYYRDYVVLTLGALLFWVSSGDYKWHYILNQVNEIDFVYALFASFIFIFIFIGFIPFWVKIFARHCRRISAPNLTAIYLYLVLWSSCCIGILLINYVYSPPPISNILSGFDKLTLAEMRYAASENSFFKLNRHVWLPSNFYVWAYICFYLKYRLRVIVPRVVKVYFWLTFIFGLIASLWSIEKSLVGSYVLGVLGIYLISSGREIGKIRLLSYLFFGLISIIVMYGLLGGGNDDLVSILDTAKYRFFGQAGGLVYSFYAFPDIFDFKYFSGVSNFLAWLSGDVFSSPYSDLIKYADPEHAEISGAMSSFAAGEAYGLFGWPGVFLGPIFVAFWYALFFETCKSLNTAIIFAGSYGLFFGNAYMASSFYSFVWPVGFAYGIFPFLLIWQLSVKRWAH